MVSFFSKTRLIDHYKESLGAKVLFGNQMLIDEVSANKLILKYFKQYIMALIKEPLNVDFYTTGKQMTEEDQKRVSEYIKRKKELKKKKEAKQPESKHHA